MKIYLTPGPWTLVERRVEGGLLPETATRPVVCQLGESNWQANGRVIAAAPQLLVELRLALKALEQPELSRIALKRGLAAVARATASDAVGVQPDQAVLAVLSGVGIIEPTLSELALTTTPELAQAWAGYARDQGLGTGFVVAQLRTGNRPPSVYPEKTWYTEAERQLIIT
jgi:hypothetical protein